MTSVMVDDVLGLGFGWLTAPRGRSSGCSFSAQGINFSIVVILDTGGKQKSLLLRLSILNRLASTVSFMFWI